MTFMEVFKRLVYAGPILGIVVAFTDSAKFVRLIAIICCVCTLLRLFNIL